MERSLAVAEARDPPLTHPAVGDGHGGRQASAAVFMEGLCRRVLTALWTRARVAHHGDMHLVTPDPEGVVLISPAQRAGTTARPTIQS